jgi:formylglycine-generating enzyme required for sulfatase activity
MAALLSILLLLAGLAAAPALAQDKTPLQKAIAACEAAEKALDRGDLATAQAQYDLAQRNAPGAKRVVDLKARLDEAERQRKEKEEAEKRQQVEDERLRKAKEEAEKRKNSEKAHQEEKKEAIVDIPIDSDLPRNYTETINGVSFDMIYVEGGTFQMGDTFGEGKGDEKPVHPVTLDGYYLGQTEVTQALWREVMGSDPPELYNEGCDQCPVERVSWEDAQAFIQKLNQRTGKKYGLPTEAQWEFAARERGRKVRFGNGKDILKPNEANFDASKFYKQPYSEVGEYRGKTIPVKTFAPNAQGLYDMSGNVWEWCQDWYDTYPSSPARNPQGPSTGSDRVGRGGSWDAVPRLLRVAYRNRGFPTYRFNDLGFRLARID